MSVELSFHDPLSNKPVSVTPDNLLKYAAFFKKLFK